jgi:hypothetical protein
MGSRPLRFGATGHQSTGEECNRDDRDEADAGCVAEERGWQQGHDRRADNHNDARRNPEMLRPPWDHRSGTMPSHDQALPPYVDEHGE